MVLGSVVAFEHGVKRRAVALDPAGWMALDFVVRTFLAIQLVTAGGLTTFPLTVRVSVADVVLVEACTATAFELPVLAVRSFGRFAARLVAALLFVADPGAVRFSVADVILVDAFPAIAFELVLFAGGSMFAANLVRAGFFAAEPGAVRISIADVFTIDACPTGAGVFPVFA